MEKLIDKTCRDFTEALASKAPVPGGGGAAALTGALGAALCAMVGNYTLGKKKYAAAEGDVRKILEKAEALQTRLLALADEDAAAFAPLSAAYAIPKDDPDRDAVLEEASLRACEAPREMVRLCCEAVKLLEEVLEKGSVMLLSDTGCGALLCGAAMRSAAMNVFVNTKSLRDRQKAKNLNDEIDALLTVYGPRADRLAGTVSCRLRKEV